MAVKTLLRLVKEVTTGDISLRQALLALGHFVSRKRRATGDDFDWEIYTSHYSEELRSIERSTRLTLNQRDFQIAAPGRLTLEGDGKIILPSHHALYEALTWFSPESLLELGVGGGDHLNNLAVLFDGVTLHGLDRSQSQLDLAITRHPSLEASLQVWDLTISPNEKLESRQIAFSHAVLMHISSKEGRFQAALDNALSLANEALVLSENWTQHDFLSSIRKSLAKAGRDDWNIYLHESSVHPNVFAIIVTLDTLSLTPLKNYDQLLQGGRIRSH